MKSIRKRLLLWLTSALLIASLVLGLVTYQITKSEIDEMFDANLQQVAIALRTQFPLPAVEQQAPETGKKVANEDDYVIQLWDTKDKLAYASHPNISLPLLKHKGLHSVSFQGDDWRVYSSPVGNGYIQVAQSLDDRLSTVKEVVSAIIVPGFIFVPLFGLLIWLAVGRGLRPLINLSDDVEALGPQAMTPLVQDNVPQEIKPLTSALNNLLERLKAAMELQRQFTADAAHELRSPLTAINLQLEILERASTVEERNSALHTLKQGIQRSIHLVQQLLMLARLEPNVSAKPFISIDFLELARLSVAQFILIAEEKKIDLGLDNRGCVLLTGDHESLRILLNNLIDNAIQHTPSGGKIDISARQTSHSIAVEVSDSGPGIPLSERERVLDRFYRAATKTQGTGLGLSIVRAIADNHNAQLKLLDSYLGGLSVRVIFPVVSDVGNDYVA